MFQSRSQSRRQRLASRLAARHAEHVPPQAARSHASRSKEKMNRKSSVGRASNAAAAEMNDFIETFQVPGRIPGFVIDTCRALGLREYSPSFLFPALRIALKEFLCNRAVTKMHVTEIE